jgi:hypothetical protein
VTIVAKRAVLAALTVIGLVLLVVGAWFTLHLGPSGSATFTARPGENRLVVLRPTVLNRVDDRVSVTVRATDKAPIWVGRATPSDVDAVVAGASHVVVDGAQVRSWTLDHHTEGTGPARNSWATADVWRSTAQGEGRVRVEVDQADAPEALAVSAPAGTLTSVTVTVERQTWFFQALLVALVGLLALAAGVAGLAQPLWRRRGPASGSRRRRTDAAPAATTHDPGDAVDPDPQDHDTEVSA